MRIPSIFGGYFILCKIGKRSFFTRTYPIFDNKPHKGKKCVRMVSKGGDGNAKEKKYETSCRQNNCESCDQNCKHGSEFCMWFFGISVARTESSETIAKVLKLSTNLTKKFLDDKVISLEEKAIVQYGLESLENNLLGLFLSLIVGALFGSVQTGLLLAVFLFPLRKSAGGYHANTKKMCMFLSTCMLICAFLVFYQHRWFVIVYVVVNIICTCIIFGIAPIGTPNKLLDSDERRVYGIRTRIILQADNVIFGIALIIGWEKVITVIVMAFSIVAVSLVMGKVKLYRLKLQSGKYIKNKV